MRRPQFSLAALGIGVAFTSIACAALVYASETWSSTLFTAVIAFLTWAILVALYRVGATRAFWVGCAVFGWTYLLVIFWPSSERIQFGTWYKMELGTELATSQLARWAYEHILPKIRTPPAAGVPAVPMPGGGQRGGGGNFFFPQFGGQQGGGGVVVPAKPPKITYPDEPTFVRVSHAVWTWLFTLIGGALGRYLYATKPTGSEQQQP